MKELAELSNRVLDSEDEMRPEELALLARMRSLRAWKTT